jgi:hypothetical protein
MVDNDETTGGGPDTIRIKIWDKNNNNAVVYDTQPGAATTATPTTALGGGDIQVHTNAAPQIASVVGTGGTSTAAASQPTPPAGFDSDPAPVAAGMGPSNPLVPVSASNPVPAPASGLTLDLLFSDLSRMLADSLHLYQSTLASVESLWWQADALFVQRFDALLSMGNGALSKSVPWTQEGEQLTSAVQAVDQLFADVEADLAQDAFLHAAGAEARH